MLALYAAAVDEYRFQVNLNWSRTQYYLAFNVGLLGVATGLIQVVAPPLTWIGAGLYAAGAVCCLLALLADGVQHGYYRNARNRMKELEAAMGIEPWGLASTPGMGATRSRLGRVSTINKLVLSMLLALDLLGIAIVVARALLTP